MNMLLFTIRIKHRSTGEWLTMVVVTNVGWPFGWSSNSCEISMTAETPASVAYILMKLYGENHSKAQRLDATDLRPKVGNGGKWLLFFLGMSLTKYGTYLTNYGIYTYIYMANIKMIGEVSKIWEMAVTIDFF